MKHSYLHRTLLGVLCLYSFGCGSGDANPAQSSLLGEPTEATENDPEKTPFSDGVTENPTESPSSSLFTPSATVCADSSPTPTPTLSGSGCGTPWDRDPTQTETPASEMPVSCEALREMARGIRPDFPPSLPNPMNCEYGASNYGISEERLPSGSAEELHLITVYEGAGAGHGPGYDERIPGVVEVVVHPRTKPVVLALSAYEPVRWRMIVEPGAVLSRVITQGYYNQEVEGLPAGVPVLSPETCDCAYGWEVVHNTGGCSYNVVVSAIRQLTGLTETSYQGCYAGDRFEVPYWSGEPPTERPTPLSGDETIPPDDIEFPGCESVTSESEYCLTATDGGIAVLGLDTGRLCEITTTNAPLFGGYTTSLAWRGELLYSCTGAGLIRISLHDGAWEAAQVPCGAVANFDGGLLLLSDPSDPYDLWGLRAYRDYQAVLDLSPYRTYDFASFVTRMAVHGEQFYGAWHSTDSLDLGDLSSGQPVGVLALENYDNWIWGMAATDLGEIVVTDGYDRVVLFDAQSGAQIHELSLAEPIFGLACSGRAEG